MFCDNCGIDLQDPNQKLCPKCGMPLRKKIVFRYNDDLNEFKDLEVDIDVRIRELLDPDFILLFVDSKQYRIWIWHGSNTTTRMKFIAAKLVPEIRDRYGIGYKILAVDEGNETLGFKIMAGLEEEIDYNRKKFILNKDKNGTSVDLASAERKIKSIMKKEDIGEIIFERQYLPEIFKADLLEISKHDGLPVLKPFVISYLKSKGISFDNIGNGIRFKKMPAPEWVKKVLNGFSFIKYLNQLKWYELQSVGTKQHSFSDEQKKNWNKQGFDYRLKFVLCGEPQFAMTALTKKFCINFSNPYERLTNGGDFHLKTIELYGNKIQVQIWNIRSVERLEPLYDLVLGVNGIIMIYLINDAEQVKRASEDIELVRKCIGGIPIFLALPNFSTFLGFSQFPELPSTEFRDLIKRYRFSEIPGVGPIGEHLLILFAKKILKGLEPKKPEVKGEREHERFDKNGLIRTDIIIFKYNDDLNQYQELDIGDNTKIREVLDSDLILVFIDPTNYRVWIWCGANTTTRMKFLATKLAPSIRDKFGFGYKISAVDEGNETLGFKTMLGRKISVHPVQIESLRRPKMLERSQIQNKKATVYHIKKKSKFILTPPQRMIFLQKILPTLLAGSIIWLISEIIFSSIFIEIKFNQAFLVFYVGVILAEAFLFNILYFVSKKDKPFLGLFFFFTFSFGAGIFSLPIIIITDFLPQVHMFVSLSFGAILITYFIGLILRENYFAEGYSWAHVFLFIIGTILVEIVFISVFDIHNFILTIPLSLAYILIIALTTMFYGSITIQENEKKPWMLSVFKLEAILLLSLIIALVIAVVVLIVIIIAIILKDSDIDLLHIFTKLGVPEPGGRKEKRKKKF